KTEPRAGLRAARFETDESLDRTAAVIRGNTESLIGDGKQHAAVLALCRDANRAFSAGSGSAVFDRVVNKIGERLADQLAITVNLHGLGRFDREMHTLFFGERFIKFGDAVRYFR